MEETGQHATETDPEVGRGLSRLPASRDKVVEAARTALRDTTCLTRLLTLLGDKAPLPDLLERTLAALSELFSADIAVLLDPGGSGLFTPLAAVGLPEDMGDRPFPADPEGPVATALRTGAPLANDAADPHFPDVLRDLGAVTAVWTPMVHERTARGLLLLARCRAVPFSAAETSLLPVLAHRIGLTLEQAQCSVQFERIIQAGHAIAASPDQNSVCDAIVRRFPAIPGAQAAALVLPGSSGLRCVALWGVAPAWSQPAVRLARTLLARQGLEINWPYAVSDLSAGGFSQAPHAGPAVRAVLAVPVRCKTGEAGVLFALRFTATDFTSHSLQAAQLYAAQATVLLDNAALYEALRDELAERTRAEERLTQAKEEAEQANRAKSAFLANMTHEIRTPMNAILGLTYLMLKTPLSDQQRKYLEQVRLTGGLLLSIIDEILDFSKISEDKLRIERIPFALAEILDSLQGMIAHQAAAKGLAFRVDVADDVPAVIVGDPTRLKQILLNLASNAVKFTRQGEVAVAVAATDRSQGEVRLRFRVRDTGVGMTAEEIARLFTPFSQADASTTRCFGGTGLGLAISRRLAEMMHGSIDVQSEPDQGSTFTFSAAFEVKEATPWPRAVAAATPPGSEAAPPPPRPRHPDHTGRKARVLLVDDNAINLEVGLALLDAAGFATGTARNGQEAVAALEHDPTGFAAVLMDVRMPVMSGYEAARAIRDRLGLADLPIIALTAHTDPAERQRCLEAGMNDYLTKPVAPERLMRVLGQWLGTDRPAGPPPRKAAPGGSGLPEIPGVDVAEGMRRVQGKAPFLAKLLRMFVTVYAPLPDLLRALLEDGDLERIGFHLHSLKGGASVLPARDIADAAHRIGRLLADITAGTADGRDRLPELLEDLSARLRRTVAGIEEALPALSDPGPGTAGTGSAPSPGAKESP